jgi:hypothetical protein
MAPKHSNQADKAKVSAKLFVENLAAGKNIKALLSLPRHLCLLIITNVPPV